MSDHEGGFGRGEVLGGADEVAFVFAGRGVEDDYEGAGFWGVLLGDGGVETGGGLLLKDVIVSSMLSKASSGAVAPFNSWFRLPLEWAGFGLSGS